MKKSILIFGILLGLAVAVNAQPRAIGGRIGNGIEASYQHGFGDKNMVEVELGLYGFNGIEVASTYDWVWGINSWKEKGSWNWYAGVGAGVGYSWWGDYVFVGAAGRIGVEYNFWFPLQLSIDYRPVIGPYFHTYSGGGAGFNSWGFYTGAFGLSARYKF